MQRNPIALTAGLIFAGLLVAAYFVTSLLAGPLAFLYRSAASFEQARSLTQIAALLSGIGFLALALIVAVPLALRPAPFARKLLDVLPAWLIGLTLGGVALNVLGIGVTGMLNFGLVQLNFAQTWTALSGLLALIAIGVAAARASFSAATIKTGTVALGITALPALATTIGMLVTVAIILTTPARLPAFGDGGGPGGRPGAQGTPGAQNRPGGQAGQTQGTPGAQVGQAQGTPGAQPRPGAQGTPGAQNSGGAGGGQGFPGGGPGGPGGAGGPPGGGPFGEGGIAALTTRFEVGGGLTALFGLLAIAGGAAGLVALRRSRGEIGGNKGKSGDSTAAGTPSTPTARPAWGKAIGALASVTLIAFLAIQLVPVAHANPAVTKPVPWDSAQTEQLWNRGCANCHSNATVWPAYAYIAPSSWINVIDVNDARSMFNISELDKVPAFITRQYPENAAERMRNGSMPPPDYRLLHPEANLTDAEKELLAAGLAKTLAAK